MSNNFVCHNVSTTTWNWQCVLCEQIVSPPGLAHFCIVEARIREIIREELDRRHPTVNEKP